MPSLKASSVSSLLSVSLASINSLLSYALVLKSTPGSLSWLLFISIFTSRSSSNLLFKSLSLKSLLLFKSLSLKSLSLFKKSLKSLFSSLFSLKSFLIVYNLYVRYVPLKSLIKLTPVKVLPRLTLGDLSNKFVPVKRMDRDLIRLCVVNN